jgi:hypothetical protein
MPTLLKTASLAQSNFRFLFFLSGFLIITISIFLFLPFKKVRTTLDPVSSPTNEVHQSILPYPDQKYTVSFITFDTGNKISTPDIEVELIDINKGKLIESKKSNEVGVVTFFVPIGSYKVNAKGNYSGSQSVHVSENSFIEFQVLSINKTD